MNRTLNPDPAVSKAVHSTLMLLPKTMFKDKIDVHSYYKKSFNSVDQFNKRVKKYMYQYGVQSWQKKMVLSILSMVCVNAYVLFAENKPHATYKVFRQNMILSLNQQGEQGKKSAGSKKGRPKGSRNK